MSRYRGGDTVELTDGTQATVTSVRFSLIGGPDTYGIRFANGREYLGIAEDAITRIAEHGKHPYWKPDARRVPQSECKRGHCYRCGVKKSEHA